MFNLNNPFSQFNGRDELEAFERLVAEEIRSIEEAHMESCAPVPDEESILRRLRNERRVAQIAVYCDEGLVFQRQGNWSTSQVSHLYQVSDIQMYDELTDNLSLRQRETATIVLTDQYGIEYRDDVRTFVEEFDLIEYEQNI